MKKLIPILLALCLLSAACAQRPREEAPPPPAPEAPAVPEPPAPEEEGRALERLTVELVVDWEDTDRVLEGRAELERLLQDADRVVQLAARQDSEELERLALQIRDAASALLKE